MLDTLMTRTFKVVTLKNVCLTFQTLLEIEKNLALRKHKGTYEAQLTLSSSAKGELSWWTKNVDKALIQFHIKILSLNLELMLQKRGGACIWMVTLPKAYGPFRKASCTLMS